MKVQLRPATEDDYEYCYRITKQNMFDLFCRHWGGWVDAEFQKGFILKNIQIILVDGKRSGYLNYIVETDGVYIDNIQIDSALHGKGIGTNILGSFISSHKESKILLTVFDDNPAKKLYERLGFQTVEKMGSTLKMEMPVQQAAVGDASVTPNM